MADAETTSRAGGLVDKALIVVMIISIAFPFSSMVPLVKYDEHLVSTSSNPTESGKVEELTGQIGILHASTSCRFFNDVAKEWEDCDRDDKLETHTETEIGDMLSCSWKPGYANANDCKDERDGWCHANQGLGWTSVVLLVVLFVASIAPGMMSDMAKDNMFMFIYFAISCFAFAIFGLAVYYAETGSNDCGFDQSETAGNDTFYGWGELGAGAYLIVVVAFLALLRFMALMFGRMNRALPERGIFFIYMLIFGLAMAAMFTTIVTLTYVNDEDVYQPIKVEKDIFYPTHSVRNVNTATPSTNHQFMEFGKCEFTFDKATDCSYEEWCTQTHVSSVAIPIFAGIGMIYAFYVFRKNIESVKWVHLLHMGILAIFSGMHMGWTVYMINEPFDIESSDDHKCGFNHEDGADGAGASIGLVGSIFAISLISLVMLLMADSDGNVSVASLKYKLIL